MKPICRAFTVLIATLLGPPLIAATDTPPLNLSDSIRAQQRLVDRRPQNPGLVNDLGNLLYLDSRLDEAEDAYRRSLELNPDYISARYNLALLLQKTERYRRAAKEFKRVIRLDPQHSWSHYQLGVLQARGGKRGAAIKSYARSMRLDVRLTDPAVNPHIVENDLASSAILFAYSDLSSASLAPRAYENPSRITDFLVNSQDLRPAPAKPVKKKRGQRKTKKSDSES